MRLPTAPREYDTFYESQKSLLLTQADQMNHKKRQDVEIGETRLILTSPDGSRFSVTVDNSGNLGTSAL